MNKEKCKKQIIKIKRNKDEQINKDKLLKCLLKLKEKIIVRPVCHTEFKDSCLFTCMLRLKPKIHFTATCEMRRDFFTPIHVV